MTKKPACLHQPIVYLEPKLIYVCVKAAALIACWRACVWKSCKKCNLYTVLRKVMDPLRRSSVKIGTIQRRLAWPLRKDDTHKSRSVNIFLQTLNTFGGAQARETYTACVHVPCHVDAACCGNGKFSPSCVSWAGLCCAWDCCGQMFPSRLQTCALSC